MKIILIKQVKKLGNKGDIIDVATGYAINFLIPQKLAVLYNENIQKEFISKQKKQQTDKEKNIKNREKLAERINKKTFEFKVKADKKGTLYAGITKKDILTLLKKQNYTFQEKEIILEKTIKKTGGYNIKLKLGNKVAKIKIKIMAL